MVFVVLSLTISCRSNKRFGHRNYSQVNLLSTNDYNKPINYKRLTILPEEVKARLFDIPFVCGNQSYSLTKTGQAAQAFYFFSKKNSSELIRYFDGEMELWGWKKISACIGFNSCFIYDKPGKICTVIMEKNNLIYQNKHKNNLIKIFVSPKIFLTKKNLK